VAYISSILGSFLGESRKHNESSGQISFDCPACSMDKGMPQGDRKGNLEINYEKDVYKCWVCKDTHNMYGSIIKLIRKYGTEKNLRDYKLFKPDAFLSNDDKQQLAITLPEGYRLISECNHKDFKYNSVIKYLESRKITKDIIDKYQIGYTTRGTYFNRIIIPSYDEDGILNYFIARWFDKQYTKIKYLNPEVEKQSIIFNEYLINWDATIYLVEGATDHIVIPNSIPLLGKFISDELLYKLHEKAKANVVILLDGDAVEDAKILYNKLNFGALVNRIRICIPPEDYDPSLINQKFGRKGIIKLLSYTNKLEKAQQLQILANK
jgi:DNA primase